MKRVRYVFVRRQRFALGLLSVPMFSSRIYRLNLGFVRVNWELWNR